MIKYIPFLFPVICQAQATLDTNQVKVANSTYVYARECKEIKDGLFIQLDSAISIIELQQAQIERYDTLSVLSDAKYSICEEDVKEARKQAQKEHRKRKVNGVLLWVASGVAVALAALYLLDK